jgi:hypothetical protein
VLNGLIIHRNGERFQSLSHQNNLTALGRDDRLWSELDYVDRMKQMLPNKWLLKCVGDNVKGNIERQLMKDVNIWWPRKEDKFWMSQERMTNQHFRRETGVPMTQYIVSIEMTETHDAREYLLFCEWWYSIWYWVYDLIETDSLLKCHAKQSIFRLVTHLLTHSPIIPIISNRDPLDISIFGFPTRFNRKVLLLCADYCSRTHEFHWSRVTPPWQSRDSIPILTPAPPLTPTLRHSQISFERVLWIDLRLECHESFHMTARWLSKSHIPQ